MPSAFISGVTMMAPMMPVVMTRAAVSAGMPPRLCEIAMATPAVTDLGASETSTARGTPIAAAMPSAETMATVEPASRAAAIGARSRRTRARLRYSGTASATVAGPSRKCTNWAPSK